MPALTPLLVIGHRGVAGHYPENTAASIRAAAKAGLSWIEVDIQPTKDGVLVVTHDHSIERCSNGQGRVDQHNLLDLYEFDFGSWKGEQFVGEPIMTLDQLLELALELELSVNLEIKLDETQQSPQLLQQVVSSMLSTLEEKGFPSAQLVISSFCQPVLREVRKQSRSVQIGVLSELLSKKDWALIEELGAYSCHLNYFWVTSTQVSKLKKLGVKVWCYTVNKPHKFKCIDLVDGVFTDYPERFK